MANAYQLLHLSASSNGAPIPVTSTSTPGATIDTATNGSAATKDLYTLICCNNDTTDRILELTIGGVLKRTPIPALKGDILIADDLPLSGGALLQVACTTSDTALFITGYKKRVVNS